MVSTVKFAEFILSYASVLGLKIGFHDLNRMLYLLQGYSISRCGYPLFDEQPQAWMSGPGYQSIDDKYTSLISAILTDRTIGQYKVAELYKELSLDSSHDRFINSPIFLGILTINSDVLLIDVLKSTPYVDARRGLRNTEPSKKEIPLDDIGKYFRALDRKYIDSCVGGG